MAEQSTRFGAAVTGLWRDGRAPSSIARTLAAPFPFVESALLEAGVSREAIELADHPPAPQTVQVLAEMEVDLRQDGPAPWRNYDLEAHTIADADGRIIARTDDTGRWCDGFGRPLDRERARIRWLHNPTEERRAGESWEYLVELPSGRWPIDGDLAQRFAEDGATVYRRRVTDWTQVAP